MIQETNVTSAGEVEIPKFVSGVVGSKSVKKTENRHGRDARQGVGVQFGLEFARIRVKYGHRWVKMT